MAARDDAFGWLYISPLMLVLLPFFVAPILVVFAASFMQSDGFGGIIASPTLQNYIDIFSSGLTANLYYETVKFTILTWLFSLIIGFWVAYFLVFHIRSPLLAIGLFLLCTVPFWTSNIIRMISWIPLLGKEGLINMALIKIGVIQAARIPVVLRFLRGGRLCASAHDLHDRADLQFHGPHRQARGGSSA